MVTKTCGIDWSEEQQDVAIVDEQARVLARARIAEDVAGFSQLLALLAEHGNGEAASIDIAIETDKGLLVAALVAAGFTVFPINPRAAARYRERHAQAGGKSDRGDAVMLANILRTDRHAHRPLPADSELARAIKSTTRAHQEAIWARQQTTNRLRSLLRDYYPQVRIAFPNLTLWVPKIPSARCVLQLPWPRRGPRSRARQDHPPCFCDCSTSPSPA
jgi:transposase